MDQDIIITGLIDGIHSMFLSNQLLGEYLGSLNHEDKLKAICTYVII